MGGASVRKGVVVAALVLVTGIGAYWLLRPEPAKVVEAPPPPPPPPPVDKPVRGAPCRVTVRVDGGELRRARLFSARAQLDLDAEITAIGFEGTVPEQGRIFIAAESLDGRSAGRWILCGGDGVADTTLELPERDPDAATIDGRCTYLDTGVAVAGAVVRGQYESGVTSHVVSALADDDGVFRLALPGGTYVFRCAKDTDEGPPTEVRIEPGTVQQVELFVEARAGVVAVVVDEDGQPLADVLVRGRTARSTLSRDDEVAESTDEEGRALLLGLPTGPVTLEAQASGLFAEGSAVAQVELPYAEATLVMRASAVQLEGHVREQNGAPVEGASVEVSTLRREDALRFKPVARVAMTDGSGHFIVGGLTPGLHLVAARRDGFADSRVEVMLPLGSSRVGLTMLSACTGEVKVMPDEPSLPVRVSLSREDGATWDLAGRTGEVLAVPNAFGTVNAFARTSGTSVRTATATGTLCERPLVLRLEGSEGDGALAVRVVDGGGDPVEGAEVWVDAPGGRAHTNASGVVRFDGLEPRAYRIQTPSAMRGTMAEVIAGQVVEVELVVDRKRGRIRGRVVASGPVEGARVLASCGDTGNAGRLEDASVVARSGADGSFEFAPSGGGVCAVRAEHPSEGRSRVVTLQAGGDPATIELTPGASIEGRVVAEDGAPVSPYTLVVRTGGSAAVVETRTQYVTDPEGAFVVKDVAAGQVSLRVSGSSGRGYAEVDVAPGSRTTGVEIRAFTRGPVVGRVVSSDGEPVERARVEIRSDGGPVAQTATGPDGRYSTVVPAGEPVRAFVNVAGFYPKGTPPVALVAGGTTDFGTLTLEKRGGDEEKEAGIGIMIAADPRGIRVLNFVDDSPAREAGMEVGDLIVGIDGVPAGQAPLMNWIVSLRGPVGTPVTLEVERGTSAAFVVTVVRRDVGLRRLPQKSP